jgi:hypothetical protein
MSPDEWYAQRDDRQLRYAGRVLPHDRPILIQLEAEYGTRYDGQVAAIVAANLLSRMSPNVAFDFPEVRIVAPLPWVGENLGQFAVETARAADPHGRFALRRAEAGDYVISLGRQRAPGAVHGSGWRAFVGPGQSSLPNSTANNPIGPAFAVVTTCARLFGLNLAPLDGPFEFDAFSWSDASSSVDEPFPSDVDLGNIWSVGAGSVGTAVLYFLTLATRRFSCTVFDMDEVKILNLDRSPIFVADDAARKLFKSAVTADYLECIGVKDVDFETDPLDLSPRWRNRPQGVPDVVIAAANERNVRYLIEQSCPPLQIYATTGKNWNIAAFRHIPLVDPCSCCAFPPESPIATMTCAEGTVRNKTTGEDVDAALPFLSFGAGLIAAAEVLKAQLPGYPTSANRIFHTMSPETAPTFVHVALRQQASCLCKTRSSSVHAQMIEKTRFANLSTHGTQGHFPRTR